MECNKDEAVRAKEIAEGKMQKNDFEGARKIALKAHSLYPELENIAQLLSICDVHCSAQKKILGSEKDWYGILQVDNFSDEMTVKKNYRKLALSLHPDKNRFPGAEAAFKLICEANVVLSDPVKKSLYDNRLRATVRSTAINPPSHHMNKSTQVKKQYGAQNNASNGPTSLNQHQPTNPSSCAGLEVFWTCCPFCGVRYQYYRASVNKTLRCQKCLKNFVAVDISADGVPLGPKWGQPSTQQVPAEPGVNKSSGHAKEVPNKGKCAVGVQDRGYPASNAGPRQGPTKESEDFKTKVGPTRQNEDFKAKGTYSCNTSARKGGKEGETCNGDAVNIEKRDPKNKSRKRGRKQIVDSSESCDASSESEQEDMTIKENFCNPASESQTSRDQFVRRSSRRRQNVSYNEGGDDVLHSSLESPQASSFPGHVRSVKKDASSEGSLHENQNSSPANADCFRSDYKEMGTVHHGESLQNENADYDKEDKAKGESGGSSRTGADTIEIKSDSEYNMHPTNNSEDIYNCDDTEFNDFDKDRDESCFSVNQFWACYDPLDGMPRFYAKVKAVFAPFELSITWLEACPIDKAYEKWIDEELPVSCGIFKFGKTEKTSARLSFSHQVHCEKGKKKGSLMIYPKQGEVWALFGDWDVSWSSNMEKHREFRYEIVEVLSDFVAEVGIKVCYLDKVEGFVSLFYRSGQSETNSFLVGPKELYKFSHRVPSFKMTGSEKTGVPVGSFELDPASLPLNPDGLCYHGKAKMESENMNPGGNYIPPRLPIKHSNPVNSESAASSSKDFVDMKATDSDLSKLQRSLRGVNAKI